MRIIEEPLWPFLNVLLCMEMHCDALVLTWFAALSFMDTLLVIVEAGCLINRLLKSNLHGMLNSTALFSVSPDPNLGQRSML
jgi:hypothetical protein